MDNDTKTREVVLRLLSNIASAREIQQYLDRFSAQDSHFAVVKVGGAILRDELDTLASSLSFLPRVGLVPIVIHGAGPQLDASLDDAGVESIRRDGMRITTTEVLRIARNVFQQQNLNLVEALQAREAGATSVISGVFEADYLDRDRFGLVGEISQVHLDPVRASVRGNCIPVIASLGETGHGQILNINADVAANHLVREIEPFKIIFVTGTGGLLDEDGQVISTINLATDYEPLMNAPWVHSGMRLKLKQISDLLADLPLSSSVSIIKPGDMARELFTHRGSGTLVRRGEHITVASSWDEIDTDRLRTLLETGFGRSLDDDYFAKTALDSAYISESYRAAAIITHGGPVAQLDKYAVAEEARGEGLGRALWQRMQTDHQRLFWRARPDNPINEFYLGESDGRVRTGEWNVYWYGIEDFSLIGQCVDRAVSRPATIG